jgi:hypothetical protein
VNRVRAASSGPKTNRSGMLAASLP